MHPCLIKFLICSNLYILYSIFRVVYPEEFDLKEASTSGDEINGKIRKRGRPSLKSHIMKDTSSNNLQDENNAAKRFVSNILNRLLLFLYKMSQFSVGLV